MTVKMFQERKVSMGYGTVYADQGAVFVDEATESTSPRCVPIKKRIRMIAKEMDEILDGAQDYLLRHMLDDDLSDEAKKALFKAAMETCYLKHYYDYSEHTVQYFPTCKDLIMKHNFLDHAETFFYQEKDEFPSDYRRAISSSVRALVRKRLLEDKERNIHRYDDLESSEESDSLDDLVSSSAHVRLDADMVDKFAASWKCHDNLDDLQDDIEDDDESDYDEFHDDEP